jgi:hypothetical protein
MDPLGRVALLARRGAVGLEPLVDQRPVGVELRRRPASRRVLGGRHRRSERLLDRAPVDAVARAPRAERQALMLAVASDLFELLHP